ncbi:MAG: hypothetical protein EOO90_23470 [Pedobacter sp.]|nr:MAG: hypothetical protein EOO90_23470 [Pedobacter sp.]
MRIIKSVLLLFLLVGYLSVHGKVSNIDTLVVVQNNDFLRYPFGKLKESKQFAIAGGVRNQSASFVRPYNSSKKEPARMLTLNNSYVKFYLDHNSKNLEIISAIILSKDVPLENEIMIGISREDFLKKMKIGNGDDVNVINLTSTNKELNHYYTFKNDRLVAITILSKLFYQK